MKKIKIITDSTADLPIEIINKYGIEVLPLLIYFGNNEYKDGVDMDIHNLLLKIKNDDIFPTTAGVNPQRFYECYKKYLDEGYKIVSIHLSSKMSGTYQSACLAKDMLKTEDIVVIDSVNVTSGLGLLVIKACKLRNEGLDIKEIQSKVNEAIPHVKSVLAFETLDNLVKGGRLSKTAGVIGSILGIKLILAVRDGEIGVVDKVRGTKKTIKYILDYIDNNGVMENEESILLHVENIDILYVLREELKNRNMEYIECMVGCTVGVHAGSGACGVFFIEKY